MQENAEQGHCRDVPSGRAFDLVRVYAAPWVEQRAEAKIDYDDEFANDTFHATENSLAHHRSGGRAAAK